MIGGPAPGLPKGVAGSVVFTNSQGSRRQVKVGSNGGFALRLPKDAYFVTSRYGPQHLPCRGSAINVVSLRETIGIDIACPAR